MNFYTVWNEKIHRYPFLADFPHSGVFIPEPIGAQMRSDAVLSNTDWFLPKLYDFFVPLGVTSLVNDLSRYVIDPNRAPVDAGVGGYKKELVYRHNTFGHPIYRFPLSAREVQYRRQAFYTVYHRKLKALTAEKRTKFGRCYLMDFHSFAVAKDVTEDLIVSNCLGESCSQGFFDLVCSAFRRQGFSVAENRTFTGGYITKRYGAQKKIEAVQVELCYNAYLGDRPYGEEEITAFDRQCFFGTKKRLQNALCEILNALE